MILRPYQQEALQAVRDKYAAGVTRQLIVLPTASGKSVIFARLPETLGLKRGKQVWLLVHTDELVSQNVGHFETANPGLKIGIEKAQQRAPLDSDIVVASVQSVGRSGSRRLKRFDPARLTALVVDEVHHAAKGQTYLDVLEHFRVYKGGDNSSPALLLGVTATPDRSDGAGLEAIADEIVLQRNIREMIADGWLADIRAHRVETEILLDKVKMSHGDFAVKDLEKTINTPERNQLLVEKYKELANGLPAIAFSCDVAHSHAIALEFRRNDISAYPVSGQTPEHERKRLISCMESGEITVLVSCGALNEGFNAPMAQVGIIARPTKSPLLFRQQIGRILRPWPAPEVVAAGIPKIKEAAIIIDLVDVSLRHRLCSVPSLFGLRHDFDLAGGSATQALAAVEEAQEKHPQLKLDSFRDLYGLRAAVQAIDLLRAPQVPEELRLLTDLCWISGPGGSYQIIGPMAHFSIRENQLGQFEIARHEAGLRRHMMTLPSLKAALERAETMIPEQDRRLLRSEAKWRMDRPSEKQIRLLARLDRDMFARFGRDMQKFTDFISSSYSKGDVSGMLSERMQQTGARR